MPLLMEIPVEDIFSGDRAREDYGNIDELVQSIMDKGVLQPITVTIEPGMEEGVYKLLAGGRRLQASIIAKNPTIPALCREYTSVVDSLEVELIENIHRKNLTWQEQAGLEKKIYELKGTMRGAAALLHQSKSLVSRHVTLAEAMEQIPELANAKTEDEAWKQLQKIRERGLVNELARRAKERSDEAPEDGVDPDIALFRKASANFVIGDSIEGMAQVADATFDFAEVDPPYGIDLDKVRKDGLDTEYTEVAAPSYSDFIDSAAKQVYRILRPNSFCIWWFGPSMQNTVKLGLKLAGFAASEVPAIWYKPNIPGQTMQPECNLGNVYESFFICRKGSPLLAQRGRKNVFEYNTPPHRDKTHPIEKPLDLMVELLNVFTFPGQSVVVPFLGSGVTLRAAYALNRIGMGWELSKAYKSAFLLKVQEDSNAGSEGDEDTEG